EGAEGGRRAGAERGQALQPRPAVRASRHRLQHLLAGGAALHVLRQLLARAVGARGGQEAFELVAARAVCHSSPSNLRTSSRIIFLTSLRAPYTRAIFISNRPAAAAPEHPSSTVRRQASQVRAETRRRTRSIARSTTSRRNSASSCLTRSSPAWRLPRSSATLPSPPPPPALRRSAARSRQA